MKKFDKPLIKHGKHGMIFYGLSKKFAYLEYKNTYI